jgi:hypothetical protein
MGAQNKVRITGCPQNGALDCVLEVRDLKLNFAKGSFHPSQVQHARFPPTHPAGNTNLKLEHLGSEGNLVHIENYKLNESSTRHIESVLE